MEIRARVVDDYGKICERVFYRHLQTLRDAGEIIVKECRKTGGLKDQFCYVRAPKNRAVSPTT